jgi:phosphoribosylanthranilate isomerase
VIRVKICGVNSQTAFDTAVAARADWVGFVFFPRSPRVVTPAAAAALSARHDGGPARVGLFVAPTDAEIADVLGIVRLDLLQLYVDARRAAEVRARFGLPVVRAVGVTSPADLPTDAGGVDGLVIEPKPPDGATRPGGNALALDWSMLAAWRAPSPWLLAGGLTVDNVAAAISASGATAVDVSSGVESERGVKDPALIRAFVAAARAGSDQALP